MSPDPHLVEAIKTHFARKSSAQLQEIVRANNSERWSPEAVAAAGEVLQDRLAGRAREPEVGEAEPPPPPPAPLGFLPLGVLTGLCGFGIIPVNRVDYADEAEPDLPMPFGPKMAWLALDTTDTEAVAAALDLQGARPATWAEGIEAAHRSSLFVTPPLADWTLALGTPLFPPDRTEAVVKPLLERLSRQFGEAQYFCTHRDVELHVWARARKGQLVRGYGWLGQEGLTLWDEGGQTKEERDLGFRSSSGQSPGVERAQNSNVATGIVCPDDRLMRPGAAGPGAGNSATLPDEAGVMQLASLWSIDPMTLDEQFKEPEVGLLGNVAWTGTA